MTPLDYVLFVTVGLAQTAGHYIPWDVLPFLVDESGQLKRVAAYVHGCLWLWAGLFVFLEVRGPSVDTRLVLHFFTVELIAAAVGTVVPRLLEALRESHKLAEDVEDLEALVRERRDG